MRTTVAIVSLALILSALAGCDMLAKATKTESEKTATPEEIEIIIPVQAELPTRGDISAHFETTSRVDAENRVQVIAEAVAECIQVNVQEGDTIQVGQILAELDKKAMLASIGQTEVQVRQSKTAYDRATSMCEEGLSSVAERDNAKFAYEQALASLETQKVQLSKHTVRAPISGILTHKLVQTGQMVASGSPIFSIVDPASFMLVINPPERELARLQPGQKAKVTVDALGTEEFDATVRRINPNVDPASGTVKVTLDFDSDTRSKLRIAAFARVRLVMDTRENALLVPKDAVLEENARKYLFIVEQEKAQPPADPQPPADADETAKPAAETTPEAGQKTKEKQPTDPDKPVFLANRVEIETGFEDSNSVEVVKGIDDSALIVVLGQHTLKPGSRVTVTNANDEILARAGLSAEDALAAAKARREDANGAANAPGKREHHLH